MGAEHRWYWRGIFTRTRAGIILFAKEKYKNHEFVNR